MTVGGINPPITRVREPFSRHYRFKTPRLLLLLYARKGKNVLVSLSAACRVLFTKNKIVNLNWLAEREHFTKLWFN